MGFFDKAGVIKNALLLLSFFYLWFLTLWFARLLSFIVHKKTSRIHQGQWWLFFGVFGLVPRARWPTVPVAMVGVFWSITETLGPGFNLLQYHSWLHWGGKDQKDIDGHEHFKEAKDSCGTKYVFTMELWDSISECEFPLLAKLDWIGCQASSLQTRLWQSYVSEFPA